jgi:hypothetical protein
MVRWDLLGFADIDLLGFEEARNGPNPYNRSLMRSNSLQVRLNESGMFANRSPFLHTVANRSTNGWQSASHRLNPYLDLYEQPSLTSTLSR